MRRRLLILAASGIFGAFVLAGDADACCHRKNRCGGGCYQQARCGGGGFRLGCHKRRAACGGCGSGYGHYYVAGGAPVGYPGGYATPQGIPTGQVPPPPPG